MYQKFQDLSTSRLRPSSVFLNLVNLIFLVVLKITSAEKITNACGRDWTPFKDEKCYLALVTPGNSLMDYSTARKTCNDLDKDATLPCIRTEEEQNFFQTFLVSQNLGNASTYWLGAKKLNGDFYWEDKSEFKYAFWSADESESTNGCAGLTSGPANPKGNWHIESCTNLNSVVCQKRQSWSAVKLQTLLMEMTDEMAAAKREIQETKSKLGFVQEELESTKLELEEAKDNLLKSSIQISDLHEKHNSTGSLLENFLTSEMDSFKHDIGVFKKEIIDIKNSSAGLTRQIVTLAGKIVQVETNMEIMNREILKGNASLSAFKNRVISVETETAMSKSLSRIEILGMKGDIEKNKLPPVGFIYIQYYGQPAPSTLWPKASWSDISSTYAGLFFRAVGGGANSFGQTQSEFAPRITSIYFSNKDTHRHTTSISLNLGSTSDPITSGGWDGGWTGLKFYTSSGEVRPKNQAVLIFKRIG